MNGQMRVSINSAERALALLAVDLGDKECDKVRASLEQLHVEILEVTALQGRIGELRAALKDGKTHHFDWVFSERRALAICLRIYRDKLKKLVGSEEKLLVETSLTDDKIGDIGDFLGRLAGQETLFREEDPTRDGDDDEDDDEDFPRPPKLNDRQVAEVRHAAEIGGSGEP